MRTPLIALGLACLAAPALAQAPANMHSPGCRSADLDESIAACTAIIQSSGQTPETLAMAYNVRGHDHVLRGQYALAIPDFDKAIALNPRYAFAHNTRGRAYAAMGQYDQAIADYSQALALMPDFAEIPFLRAQAYESKGMRDQAIADYRATLRLKPGLQDAIDGLGRLHAAP
ncbi:MAG TPA: tetratricopeptide repeat protein [Caulobacteraceae bacterium]|nr:tetratricopeptide repeat protein [Caulobacteraceae bacterium]